MPRFIIHHNGAYNIYSTVSDGAYYEPALTLEQLTQEVREQGGQEAVDQLPERLARARQKGCSSIGTDTLADCISCNRAGPDEATLTDDEFIRRFLTLPAA